VPCRVSNSDYKKVLESIKIAKQIDSADLLNVAKTALRTKLRAELADHLADVIHMCTVATVCSD